MATSHGGDFVPTGPTHNLGYEPDKFAVKTIVAVPAAVIVTGVLAFVITDLVFGTFFAPKSTVLTPEVPAAAVRNEAPMNERFARMSSTDPNAEVLQPRLEAIEQKQIYYRDGNPKNTDPGNLVTPEMGTTSPTRDGNSPRYHAEDLRPERVAATSTYAKDPQTGTVRVPVARALELAADPKNADWAKALQARPGAVRFDDDPRFGWDRPKESNGGNARWPEPSKPTEVKK